MLRRCTRICTREWRVAFFASIDCQVVPSPLFRRSDLNRLLLVERPRFRPRHASALGKYGAVFFDVVSGVFFQFLHQVRHRPDVTLEGPSEHAFEKARDSHLKRGFQLMFARGADAPK